MALTGRTTVVGLFGDPVSHSLSPQMQNYAIRKSGLDAVYVPFHVTPTQLCDAVTAIRTLGIRGINLTIPHKETVCELLDELTEEAALIGAVNTIVNHEGRLIGHNTDGIGLLKALKDGLSVDLRGTRVMLIGAGGACRAAAVALASSGVSWIGVANRHLNRAENLITEIAPRFEGTAFAAYPLDQDLILRLNAPVDVLINTTAVGLYKDAFEFEVLSCVASSGTVYDMVYAADMTPLVRDALARQFKASDGLMMLAGQGEAAFQLWFGREAPEGAMLEKLRTVSGVI